MEMYGADMECVNNCKDMGWMSMNSCTMENHCDMGPTVVFGPSDVEEYSYEYYGGSYDIPGNYYYNGNEYTYYGTPLTN